MRVRSRWNTKSYSQRWRLSQGHRAGMVDDLAQAEEKNGGRRGRWPATGGGRVES